MAFGLDPGKLGFKLGDVLVGLKSGTTDIPETITSDQGKLHTLGYVWNTTSMAYELPTVNADGGLAVHVTNPGGSSGGGLTDAELRASPVPVILPPGGGGLTNTELRAAPVGVSDDAAVNLLRVVANLLMSPAAYDSVLNRFRETTVVESGTLTGITNAVGVGNIATIDGRNGAMAINALDHTAWALNVRARIT